MKPISPPFVTSSPSGRCCSTGHPVLADPLTGRTVCSCKIQTGVPAYLSRVPSLPENVYARSSMEHMNKLSVISEQNRSPFYQKFPVEKHTTGISTATPNVHPYYLEHMIAAHPYGAMYPGFDINGNRRKNASKESTGPLKAWLYQHRKNPYPTKGEKVMLAIISQMTLTQVSTWFANARRRLKKESKMADKDVDLSDLDIDDSGIHNDSFSSHVTDSDIESPVSVGNISKSSPELSDISDSESQQESCDRKSNSACAQRLFSPEGRTEHHFDRSSSPSEDNKFNQSLSNDKNSVSDSKNCTKDFGMYRKDTNTPTSSSTSNGNQQKPKIWSIAQMLG